MKRNLTAVILIAIRFPAEGLDGKICKDLHLWVYEMNSRRGTHIAGRYLASGAIANNGLAIGNQARMSCQALYTKRRKVQGVFKKWMPFLLSSRIRRI